MAAHLRARSSGQRPKAHVQTTGSSRRRAENSGVSPTTKAPPAPPGGAFSITPTAAASVTPSYSSSMTFNMGWKNVKHDRIGRAGITTADDLKAKAVGALRRLQNRLHLVRAFFAGRS
jgi:hypothetical protein